MKKLGLQCFVVLMISISFLSITLADEIIDNDSPDVVVNGTWNSSTLVSGYYGNDYLWTYGGSGDASVEWVFQVTSEGYYQVMAWWSAPYWTRSPDAPYTIYHDDGSTTVPVDQTTDGGQWNDLGTYYFSAGEARVVLSNDAQGNPVADAVQIISVGEPGTLAAAFTASPLAGPEPLTVDFVDQSSGDVETWFWDFGDGTTSTAQNPSHTYQNSGIYTVSLTVTGGGEESTETKNDYINVTSGDDIAYDFIWPIAEDDFFVFQAFGNQRMEQPGAYHAGTDFGVYRFDAEIRCMANGYVEKINTGYGFSIMIRHLLPNGETVYSWYNHMANSVANDFSVGEFVPMGTVIGIVGETGLVYSGLHLHLEIKKTSDYDNGYLFNLSNHYNPYEFILSRLSYDPNPPALCDDGTPIDECSAESPFNCIEGGILVENSLYCDCDSGVPQTDATCSKTEDGIIVDNDDPGFESTGNWELSTTVMGFYGSDYLVADAEDGNSTATWTPDIPTAGYYEVYGWWRDRFSGAVFSERATDAVITINHAGAQDQVTVDYSDYYKEWKYLGTFLFEAGTNNSVVLSSTLDGDVVADAFRFVLDSATVAPVAGFSGSPISGTAPLTVAFTDSSTGDVTTWSWDFGDGGTSTAQNPSHEYATAGQYTVALTVTGPGGSDTETKTNYIDVSSTPVAPVAGFSGNPTTGVAPLTVAFTDSSTGDVTTWSWDFGDGGTSTAQNPSHEYATAGQYTVALTVTGPGGSDTETKTNYIDVSSTPVAPVAGFGGSPISGTAPLTVAFTDSSTGDVTTWSWDFGDGGTSTAQNPSHEYATAGQYTVALTVTGPGGSDTETKTNYIDVSSTPVAPVAGFGGSPISGTAPLTVAFTDSSTGDVTTWSWDFGDGGTSTAQNPSHEYATAGQYTVALTVTGPGGSDTETKTNYIDVSSTPVAPVAGFSGNPTTGVAPLTVAFTDSSTGDVTTWSWDFGDGGTSTAQNPSHEYATAGQYTVSLTVTGPGGSDTETKTNYIDVTSTPVAFEQIIDNDSTDFTTIGTWNSSTLVSGYYGNDYLWTNGGNGSVSAEWTFQLPTDGYFQVQVWYSAPYSSRSSDAPYTIYHADGTTTVDVDQRSDGGQWNDIGTYYFLSGTARVVLTNDATGYPVADAVRIIELTSPVADFAATPENGEAPLSVSFDNQSAGNIDTYSWNFGDGGTSTEENPVHEYLAAGVYTVTLEVTGPEGSDIETKTDLIVVTEPGNFEQIIDNDAAEVVANGTWYSSTLVSGYYGNNYYWTYGGGTQASLEYIFQLPTAGSYQVLVWWSAPYSTRSPDAPFTIYHADGTTTVDVDQTINGGQWNDLGIYNFSAGEARVVLSDDAQGNPVADAVRIVSVE